jgi:hypothetical protein
MTYALATINPHYAARLRRAATAQPTEPGEGRTPKRGVPRYAHLPQAPITGSPCPHLTSLYHNSDGERGRYGDKSYPGNCSGNLIRDLLTFFRPGLVLDPMSGSGTCRDVCEELGIPCLASDIHQGQDACDPRDFSPAETFDFIWAHPPYWRMKLYADDPRDLSRAPTLDHFLSRVGVFIRNCRNALKRGGHLAILMGEYHDREAGQVPLVYHTKRLAFAAGLTQPCTDIIRFSHGNSSSRKVYRSSFIPGLHDTCMIFERS